MVCAAKGGDIVGGEAVIVAMLTGGEVDPSPDVEGEKREARARRIEGLNLAVEARLLPRRQREGLRKAGG